jgi:hypothetical protein
MGCFDFVGDSLLRIAHSAQHDRADEFAEGQPLQRAVALSHSSRKKA